MNCIKNLKYTFYVINPNGKDVRFKVLIKRPDIDWYPYIDSIPKEHISEELLIKGRESKRFEIKCIYNSEDNRLNAGNLSYIEVEIINEESIE